MTVLRRKFEHVGLGKIERREWMLQNHHTGQILNLRRHWKAVVKVNTPRSTSIWMGDTNFAQPGQILDMSMIFKQRSSLSILCPWCNAENECSSEELQVEWYVVFVANHVHTG